MSQHSTHHTSGRGVAGLALAIVAALVLSACAPGDRTTPDASADGGSPQARDQMMADYGLAGLDTRQVIDTLDALAVVDRPGTLMASVRPHELLLTDDQQREIALAIPEDTFYVSIAPYIDQTHDCYFHSLTTCKGEIQNSDVHVLVTDAASGEILIDETRTTYDNGFVGLWLPRGPDVTVTIEYDGRSATSDLSTKGDDDATCVTTMQLS
ncbi:MAG: CueP family metal-binding protein [Demequina sp.]|nr:CueP family metal-binding protein [Demequina sp.]